MHNRSCRFLVRFGLAFIVAGIGLGSRTVAQTSAQSPTDCNKLHPQIYSKGCTNTCFGGSILLDAGEGYASYEWSNGARSRQILINSPEQSGNYTCRVSTDASCSALSPAVGATILPAADKPYIVQQGSVLTCTEASSYTWFYNGKPLALSTRSITPTATGEYRVMISDANGCSALSEAITLNSLEVNVPERHRDARLRVYPNPSDGRVTVQLISDFEGDIAFSVYDVGGREILNTQWLHPKVFDTFFLDLTTLSNGAYILHAEDGVDVITERILIER